MPFTGQKLGPSWATFWFKLDLDIPAAWAGEKVLLIFDRKDGWMDGCDGWTDGEGASLTFILY